MSRRLVLQTSDAELSLSESDVMDVVMGALEGGMLSQTQRALVALAAKREVRRRWWWKEKVAGVGGLGSVDVDDVDSKTPTTDVTVAIGQHNVKVTT